MTYNAYNVFLDCTTIFHYSFLNMLKKMSLIIRPTFFVFCSLAHDILKVWQWHSKKSQDLALFCPYPFSWWIIKQNKKKRKNRRKPQKEAPEPHLGAKISWRPDNAWALFSPSNHTATPLSRKYNMVVFFSGSQSTHSHPLLKPK